MTSNFICREFLQVTSVSFSRVYTSEPHASSVDKWQNITLKGDSKIQLRVSTCAHVSFSMFIYLAWGNSYNWIWHFAQYMNYITLEGRLQISVDSFFMYICDFLYAYLTWGTHTIWVGNHLQLETEDSCSCWIGLLIEENPIYIESATSFLNVTQPALGHPQAPSLSDERNKSWKFTILLPPVAHNPRHSHVVATDRYQTS